VSVWCGTLQIIKFDTIIYACMVWHITVYSLKKIIKNWGTIVCACMVRHSNAQQLLIICCTVVWHSPVLNVLIHLFELTSVLVQHSMVSKIINKNVLMVKLNTCQHAYMGTFCTWMSYTRVYLGNTRTLNNSVLCFICYLYFSGTSKYAMF
jgi:hypothetical protein